MTKIEMPSGDGRQIWPPEIHRPYSQLDHAQALARLAQEAALLDRRAKLALALAFLSIGSFVVLYAALQLLSSFNDRSWWWQFFVGLVFYGISPTTGIGATILGIKSWKVIQAKWAVIISIIVGFFYGASWVAYTFFRK